MARRALGGPRRRDREAGDVDLPARRAPRAGARRGLGGPPSPAALAQLGGVDGSIRLVVAGGPGGDWQVEFKLGPGTIPETPTTTVTLLAEDADRMERGELNPMEAFMAGRIQVAGDMTLMMQLQAAQMQAATAAAAAAAAK